MTNGTQDNTAVANMYHVEKELICRQDFFRNYLLFDDEHDDDDQDAGEADNDSVLVVVLTEQEICSHVEVHRTGCAVNKYQREERGRGQCLGGPRRVFICHVPIRSVSNYDNRWRKFMECNDILIQVLLKLTYNQTKTYTHRSIY